MNPSPENNPQPLPIPNEEEPPRFQPQVMETTLYCPFCHRRHIDRPDLDTDDGIDWSAEPHEDHTCERCGRKFRTEPACIGVAFDAAGSAGVGFLSGRNYDNARIIPRWRELRAIPAAERTRRQEEELLVLANWLAAHVKS